MIEDPDADLARMDAIALATEVRRLRAGLREHRDQSMHGLCWHHPALWGLLPEPIEPSIAVPEWPQFIRGCVKYRQSLDQQAPQAPRIAREHGED